MRKKGGLNEKEMAWRYERGRDTTLEYMAMV
jgi:hypothetical protein